MFNQIFPIIFLALLGFTFKRSGFLSQDTVDGLKKIIVNLALPSVLFLSFLRLELDSKYISLSALIFFVCLALFIAARLFHRVVAPDHPYFPFLATGFEYGMLGVALFGGVYGVDNIKYIAVVDLGHEFFIWFVMLPLLLVKKNGRNKVGGLIKTFITNPVVIGIVSGVLLNVMGLTSLVENSPVTGGLVKSMEFLSQLTVPLILLVIGFGIELEFSQFADVIKIVLYRYVTVLPLIFILNNYVIDRLLGLENLFQSALFTLFILPSPFIIPLFMEEGARTEKEFINSVLAVQTLLALCAFSLYQLLQI